MFVVHYVMQRPWLDHGCYPKKGNHGSRPKKTVFYLHFFKSKTFFEHSLSIA